MTLHVAHSVIFDETIFSVLGENLSNNPEVISEVGPGSPYPQFALVVGQKPRLAFSTRAVAAGLGLVGSTGVAIESPDTLWATFAKIGNNGLYASGSVHRRYTVGNGILIPRRLTAASRQVATMDLECLAFSSDGAAHPFAIADNVALPTVPVDNAHHTIHSALIGVSGSTATIGCLNQLDIEWQNNAETHNCGSKPFDTLIHQATIAPVLTLRGINASAFGASGVPAIGMPIDHATTEIILKKYDAAGIGFVDDETAEHILITACGVAVVTEHTAQGTSRGEVTIQITTRWDGTNAPITIDTAYALA